MATKKANLSKLFVFVIQDEEGKIQKIIPGENYEQLWIVGTTEAKSMRGYWEMRDLSGRFIDGNYKPLAQR